MQKKLCAAFLLAVTGLSQGEITDIQGQTRSSVQEFINGTPASVNVDESGPSGSLPVGSVAEFDSTTLDGALIGQGRARTTIENFSLAGAANPEELSLEAACYSNDASVSYLVSTSAVETREVVLSGSQISSSGIAQSTVSLSGALLVWSVGPETKGDIEGSVRFLISGSDGREVFDIGLDLSIDSTGEPQMASRSGLVIETVSLAELADRGVDAESIEILQEVDRSGQLAIFIIPFQQHRYSYRASPSRPFTLTARMEASLRNAPDGTGIAVAFGRPFSELTQFIESGLPGVAGEKVQTAINRVLAGKSEGNSHHGDATSSTTSPRPCGAVGFETLILLLVPGVFHMSTLIRAPLSAGTKKANP